MSSYIRPFDILAQTSNLVVTASTQPLTITGSGIGTRSIRICNVGTQTIFIAFGISTVTASITTSTPILPNSAEVFLLRNETTTVAAIAASTGSTIYATVGESA